jgi:hypothetical protein
MAVLAPVSIVYMGTSDRYSRTEANPRFKPMDRTSSLSGDLLDRRRVSTSIKEERPSDIRDTARCIWRCVDIFCILGSQ